MIEVLACALLALLAVGILLRPWLMQQPEALARRRANVRAYRARLRELEDEAAARVLAPEALEEARAELAERLLEDAAETEDPVAARASAWPAWVAGLAVPLLALAWYLAEGRWTVHQQIAQVAEDPAAGQAAALAGLVEQLESRLQNAPEDPEGWRMLGRAYRAQGRADAAAVAFARASDLLQGRDPDLLVDQAEALALAHGHNLQGRPRELLERAVQLAPGHPRALWYAGLAAAQADEVEVAARHWRQLLAQELPDEVRRGVEQSLAQLGPLEAPAGSDVRLQLDITIDPALAGQVQPQDSLFIAVRAADGPRAPLAVQRRRAGELPLRVTLDDAHSMVPGLRLSAFDAWIITARISRSGTAEPQPGDLEGQAVVRRAPGTTALQLQIDEIRS